MVGELKKSLNSNKNRNVRIVKVKKDRVCKHCGKVIPKGTECLTINKKLEGRVWECLHCVELELKIEEVRSMKDGLAFGDEGGWLALNDYENELLSEFYDI